jgi:hypothetical protein
MLLLKFTVVILPTLQIDDVCLLVGGRDFVISVLKAQGGHKVLYEFAIVLRTNIRL